MVMNSRHRGLLYMASMMAMMADSNSRKMFGERVVDIHGTSERKPPEKKIFTIHGVEVEATSYKSALQKAKRKRGKNKSKNKRRKKR